MKVIYIIGPYRAETERELVLNIRRAEVASLFVWQNGGVAICPHMNTAFFGGACPDEVWLKGYLEILKRCDGGFTTRYWENSEGSLAEVALAEKLRIPIFHNYTGMRDFLMGKVMLDNQLTPRELEILQLTAEGLISRQIGDQLGISDQTVKNHKTNIYAKLGTVCAAQAVAIALRKGIIK